LEPMLETHEFVLIYDWCDEKTSKLKVLSIPTLGLSVFFTNISKSFIWFSLYRIIAGICPVGSFDFSIFCTNSWVSGLRRVCRGTDRIWNAPW
jgi:hypothetical protein